MNRLLRTVLMVNVMLLLSVVLLCPTADVSARVTGEYRACQDNEKACSERCTASDDGTPSFVKKCTAKCKVTYSRCVSAIYKRLDDERTKAILKKGLKGVNACHAKQDKCNLKCNKRFPNDRVGYDDCSDNVCAKNHAICTGRVHQRNPLPDVDDSGKVAVDYNKYLSRCKVTNRKAELKCIRTYPTKAQKTDMKACIKVANVKYVKCQGKIYDKLTSDKTRRVMNKRSLGNAKCDKAGYNCLKKCEKKPDNQLEACNQTCGNKETQCMDRVARKYQLP